MALTAVLFCFLVLNCITALNAQCGHLNYTTINNVRRSTAYNATYDLCDRGLIQDGSWYRFKSAAGDKMPEFDPKIKHCGTYIPIWMKGKHPATPGEVVDRIACASVPRRRPLGCGEKFNIKVINCSSFFLYQLKALSRCTYAYCAGTKLPGSCSSDGSSIPVCPGVVPIITRPKASPEDEPSQFVALRCAWDYRYDASNIEFHVRWFRDSSDTSHAFEQKINGNAAQKDYKSLYKDNIEQNNGYEWNKQVFCKVRAKFHGGNWSMWKSSKTIFTGIVVHPTVIYFNDCDKSSKKEIFVSLRPHLPIRIRDFHFEVSYNATENILDKICIKKTKTTNVAGATISDCSTALTKIHNRHRPLWIKILAVCATIRNGAKSRGNLEVSFHKKFVDFRNNEFWQSYIFPSIRLSVAKVTTQFCESTTDPNIKTFDGRYYNPGRVGTYRLYRNRYTGTEVQTRLNYCCNCGVAIKEGFHFKIVELCSSIAAGNRFPTARSTNSQNMAKNGYYIEITKGNTKIVHLPSGITVTVKRGFRLDALDIIINAPNPYDPQMGLHDKHRHSEGLCGNFNGDPDDDFEGMSHDQFYDLHRIDSQSEDLFNMKADKTKDKKLYNTCKEEQVCVCENGGKIACDNVATVDKCFPREQNGTIQTDGDLCRGKQFAVKDGKRRRRALDTRDDDIDDQDVIPPYNPPIRNYTAPSWPTPSGLTEENVTEICNRRIRYSKGGESCGAVAGVDLDALVDQCISDIKLTDDLSWAVANFEAMNEICTKNVYRNITYYKNSTDGKLSLETTVLDSLCPNDCSDRGNCSNSTCTCFEDYTADDCSISLKDGPILYGIRKSGLCDVRRRPCRNVGIYAFPLLDSEYLTCHVQEFKVIESAWIPDSSISLYPGLMMDITEVKCSLPESPVNIGDYGDQGITAAGLKIAVSNNRINISKESMTFITYDSVCQECNTTTKGCRLKTDACFISAHCFAQNQSHPNDWCQQCLPEISTKSWEKRRDNQRPKFTTSAVLHAFLGKELRVQLSAIDPENRTIRYTFAKNSTLGASLTERGLFTCTKNTNDSTIVIFNVTDECVAYSVLHASVVIKECPCQNSGECHPDYRYLDGAGNFTCSCPAGYTGTLCELDVNECAVSKPCINGNCNNEQPGFSCSCYVGYTGDLCQTEIDDCASNPCFFGVPCSDMLASFSCGPCPSGYTGNGETCTRIDGKVDECVSKPQVCHTNARCVYHNGSYVCQCTDGYTGDGKNNCTDVDECIQTPDICHQNANCINTEGSYSCQCLKGYTGDGKLNCSDIDECTSPNVCIQNSQCSNTVGSYVCQCAVGYSGDGYSNCTDVDECVRSPDICHQNANCINTEGSYSCQCLKGYTGDGKLNCSDIDECTSPNACIQNSQCSNTVGSYVCQCAVGYSGDGYSNCTDINECSSVPSVCHKNATCSNSEGTYSCRCESGYSGEGKINCTDIDECLAIPNICHQFAICSNVPGSYSCHCRTGFSGNGKLNCDDINECRQAPSVCHRLAKCSNTEGSFSCQCDIGFTGDGIVNCTDIDECSQSSSVCHQHAKCTNTIGHFSCQCNQGFLGGGIQNCTENGPPQFTIPSAVYAILNNDFEIQIMAVDPENQDMTFTLLSNGTLTTARISKQLLTISNLKKNGTVYVQVEDEMGGKNILILQVNALECPCVHNGKCYQNKTIVYPVQPSDYLCQCEDPYTGDRCEIRPNPCDKLPCYPGLKCSTAQNSEGFTCEDCPTLFEGDGKQCELKPTEDKSSVASELTLTDQIWDDQLKTKTSDVYKNLVSILTVQIKNVYKNRADFSYVIIKGFRRGSIIVDFELIFTKKKIEDPLKPLMKVVETGKLGNMTVKIKTMPVDVDETSGDSSEDKILGLHKTILFVIVGAAAVFILMISVVIYRRIKRHRTHRKAKLRPKILTTSDKKPQGIEFQSADQGSGEEIDLKVFDNEAIHLDEEIKLQH